jgi:hypothetical protein
MGSLPLEATGILYSLAEPLAKAGVPIFAVSTFNTDYLLVRDRDIGRAEEAVTRAGHRMSDL